MRSLKGCPHSFVAFAEVFSSSFLFALRIPPSVTLISTNPKPTIEPLSLLFDLLRRSPPHFRIWLCRSSFCRTPGDSLQPDKGNPAMSYGDTKHLQETLKRELWSEARLWMQQRAQILWDGGLPDEAPALYSEFARGPALGK